MKLVQKIKKYIAFSSSDGAIRWWRNRGIEIGEGCVIRHPRYVDIDVTRTCLIKIGNHVRMNKGFTLMTHDFASAVFIQKYHDFVGSSGKITIGNNVYFGRNCTVLKGVTIGDNCIIGFGSTVMKDIPANSVAAGTPAKVICSLEEYYEKRKNKSLAEALEYARTIQERLDRRPIPSDFYEEFPFFVDSENIDMYPMIPISDQLGSSYDIWINNHKRTFNTFDDFLNAAGL